MSKFFVLKFISTVCLLFLIQQSVLSYEYKLYDTQTKISYKAQMITIEAPKKHFYLGLYAPSSDKPIYCVIGDKVNKKAKDILSGNCYEFFNETGYKYNWQELNENTFVKEKNDIIIERKQDGLKYARPVLDLNKNSKKY